MVLVLAHRGASKVARENTVEAFAAARHLGADGVEMDVRCSAGGTLVVHHDAEVAGLGPIVALRAAQLPAYVPLLDAALEACHDLVVNLELKELPGEPGYDPGYPLAARVAQLVAERDLIGRVVVSSFDLRALDAVRAVQPSVVTGWLTPGWFDQASALESVRRHGHRALHPQHQAVTEALVAAAHEAGVGITTWTADEATRIGELAQLGVDAIITNAPDVARAALAG